MASFEEHIHQAKNNLSFLVETNIRNSSNWAWQVTISFYVAVHTINAHIAKMANLHYRTHEDVKNAINPHNPLSVTKIPENVYLSYAKLQGLSRRARYLCHEDYEKKETRAFFTYDRHFAKAIKNLDKLLDYFQQEYSINWGNMEVGCMDLSKKDTLLVFKVRT